jgi:hypothetical protein
VAEEREESERDSESEKMFKKDAQEREREREKTKEGEGERGIQQYLESTSIEPTVTLTPLGGLANGYSERKETQNRKRGEKKDFDTSSKNTRGTKRKG